MLKQGIDIYLTNLTGKPVDIVVFNQDPDIDGMYDTVFPRAWKVCPLGDHGTIKTFYPLNLQIGVSETNTPYANDGRTIIKECWQGDDWNFYVDAENFNYLNKEGSHSMVDPTINCKNMADKRVDISLYKDNAPLLTQPQVGKNRVAGFKLTPTLYFMTANNLSESDVIKSYVHDSVAKRVDMTGKKVVRLTATEDSDTGEVFWSMESEAI